MDAQHTILTPVGTLTEPEPKGEIPLCTGSPGWPEPPAVQAVISTMRRGATLPSSLSDAHMKTVHHTV
jgi:hypothetical protein